MKKTLEEDNADRILSNSTGLTGQVPWLTTLPKDFNTILDIGCGAGYHSKFFHDLGYDVTALDHSLDAFQFKNGIRNIEVGFFDFRPQEPFDAVFCSHVMEHVPDTRRAFQHARNLLKPGGYLFVVVPCYTPYVCNGHWSVGWNVGQLGAWLVSNGFDCRESTFATLGINVCGYGLKSDAVPTSEFGFSLPTIVEFMPPPFRALHGFIGTDELIWADISWLDPTDLTKKPKVTKTAIPHFNSAMLLGDVPMLMDCTWNDRAVILDQPRDLSNREITIVTVVQGADCAMRLCVGSNKQAGPFANNADYWNEYPVGISTIMVQSNFLTNRMGTVDWTAIDQVGFGGPLKAGAVVRFGVFDSSGHLLVNNSGQKIQDNDR